MQVKAAALAAICGFLFVSSAALGDYDDEAEKENEALGTSSSTGKGNPFKGVFGLFSEDDVHEALKGKFIDTLDGDSTFAAPKTTIAQQGKMLLRTSGSGIANIPELERYMNKVLRRLLKAAPMQELQAKAMIMAKGDFDARSTPDGGIFLTHGMLRSIESEDELAYVLAHELSHVILNHHGTDWFVTARKHATAMAELILEIRRVIKSRSANAEMTPAEKLKFAAASTAAEVLSDSVLWPSFSRKQEDEADLLGTDILIRAGYSGLGVVNFLERQAEADKQRKSAEALEAVDYKSMMEEEFKSKGVKGFVDGLTNIAIDQFGRLGGELKGSFGHDHRETEDRLDSMSEYVDREYEDKTGLAVVSAPWIDVKNDRSVDGVLKAYRLAELAEASATAGKLEKANGLLRRSTQTKIVRDHSFHFLKAAHVSLKRGDAKTAGRYLSQATRDKDAPLTAYSRLAELYRDHGRWKETAAIVNKAAKDFENPLQLMPLRILVAHNRRNKGAVKALLIKCKLGGEKSTFKICKKSSKGQFDPETYKVALGTTHTPVQQKLSVGDTVETQPNSLNVRAGATASTAKLFSLSRNSLLTVLDKEKNWIRIRDDQQREGWVAARFTSLVERAKATSPKAQKTAGTPSAKEPPVPKTTSEPKQPKAMAREQVSPGLPKERATPKPEKTRVAQEAPEKSAGKSSEATLEERLMRLKKLHEKKLITDEDYEKKREKLLESL